MELILITMLVSEKLLKGEEKEEVETTHNRELARKITETNFSQNFHN